MTEFEKNEGPCPRAEAGAPAAGFAIDKEAFGAFVASLRREKGLTQKQLAARLLVSDKAVSKWERGLSMPDIQLLRPLAAALGVSVAELLDCRRLPDAPLSAGQAEALVQRAIDLSAPGQTLPRARRGALLAASLAGAAGVCLLLRLLGMPWGEMAAGALGPTALAAVFLGYFCLGVRLRLPDFYDQNKICFYADGPFRMSMAGVAFTNRNWPHIVAACQRGLAGSVAAVPALGGAAWLLGLPAEAGLIAGAVCLMALLFGPAFYVGFKYK